MATKQTEIVEPVDNSSAVVPEPVEHTEQTYVVLGTHTVHGHAPGETFTMLIPADQEALLLESGSLARHTTKEGE